MAYSENPQHSTTAATSGFAPEPRLTLTVKSRSGEAYAGGEVTDAPDDGVILRFSQACPPTLSVGEGVILSCRLPQRRMPVELDATVVSRVETDAGRRYRLRFDQQGDGPEEVSRQFYRYVNRREADRVEPDAEHRVEVTLRVTGEQTGALTVTGFLKDISATGLSVLTQQTVDLALAGVERLEVSLRLPTSSRIVRLAARICSRMLEGRAVSYALQFESERCTEFLAQQEDIMDYVMARLIESLRSKAP